MNFLDLDTASLSFKTYYHSINYTKDCIKSLYKALGVFMNPGNKLNFTNAVILPYEFDKFRLKNQLDADKAPCFIKFDYKYGLIKVKYEYPYAMSADYDNLSGKKWEQWVPTEKDFELSWSIFMNPGTGIRTEDFKEEQVTLPKEKVHFGEIFDKSNLDTDLIFRPNIDSDSSIPENEGFTFFKQLFSNPNMVFCFLQKPSDCNDLYNSHGQYKPSVESRVETTASFELCLGELTILPGYPKNSNIRPRLISLDENNPYQYSYRFTGYENCFQYEKYNINDINVFWTKYNAFVSENREQNDEE